MFLVVRPIRPKPPTPLELSGHPFKKKFLVVRSLTPLLVVRPLKEELFSASLSQVFATTIYQEHIELMRCHEKPFF